MNKIAKRSLFAAALVAVMAIGLLLFIGEYLFRAKDWVVFPGSPHVYSGVNLNSGIVTDREGTLLLDSTDGREYTDDTTLRKSIIHIFGDRYGYINAPLLNQFGDKLIGFDLINGIYTVSTKQPTLTTTLSAEAQKAALEALGGYKGCIGVYNYKTGEILCAVTTPTYDPDNVPDIENDASGAYDGAYVNRFFQATYVPGSIFKVMTAAAALDDIPDIRSQTFTCEGSTEIAGETVVCNGVHGTIDLEEALMESCNVAFAEISNQLGKQQLTAMADKVGIAKPLDIDGITTAKGSFDLTEAGSFELGWAGIGQYTDLINPCQYMTFIGSIAGGGVSAKPYLVKSISRGLLPSYSAKTTMFDRVMSAKAAGVLSDIMESAVQNIYGSYNFPDITVCAKSGTAEQGAGKQANAMFAGFVKDSDYPLAFMVVVEGGGAGGETCAPMAGKVLAACMDSMG